MNRINVGWAGESWGFKEKLAGASLNGDSRQLDAPEKDSDVTRFQDLDCGVEVRNSLGAEAE